MKSNIFNSVQLTKPQTNVFDLTHDVKMSGKMGELYPIMALECVPGDKFHIGCDSMIRFAPMLAPVMHRIDVTMHYFFVPNRLVWDGWERWITANTEDPAAYPYFNVNKGLSVNVKRFLDYFGIPPMDPGPATGTYKLNALALGAYQMIYNEYYRDQNLIDPVNFALVDGDNSANADLFTLRLRAYEHDYFTASLPFAQKGAAVSIPLGEVQIKDTWEALGKLPSWKYDDLTSSGGPGMIIVPPVIPRNVEITDTGGTPIAYDPNGSLEVGSTTINDLRVAFRLQEWLERNALGGTRYIEHIRAHYGIHSSDKRLQRPEYITGVKSPVVISEVLNTTGPSEFYDGSGTEQTGSPQGTMSGHGAAVTSGRVGSYFCEEHGYIIGVMSCIPRTAYQQGVPKHFLKDDYLDIYFPKFAHLGEQSVVQPEIYIDTLTPTQVFGYVPRYSEYKYHPSRVAGDFRTTLNYWHLGRIFSADPALSQEFIECDPADPLRIFAVQDGTDYLWMHIMNRVKAIRPMPVYGTPMI